MAAMMAMASNLQQQQQHQQQPIVANLMASLANDVQAAQQQNNPAQQQEQQQQSMQSSQSQVSVQQLVAHAEQLWAQNQHMPSMEVFGQAIEQAGIVHGPESEELFTLLNSRAMRFVALQQMDMARIDHMAALQLLISAQGLNDPETVGSIAGVTKVYTDQGLKFDDFQQDLGALAQQSWERQQYSEAIQCMGHVIRQAMGKFGPVSSAVCEGYNRRAVFLLQAGATERAQQDHLASIRAITQEKGANSPETLTAIAAIKKIYSDNNIPFAQLE